MSELISGLIAQVFGMKVKLQYQQQNWLNIQKKPCIRDKMDTDLSLQRVTCELTTLLFIQIKI